MTDSLIIDEKDSSPCESRITAPPPSTILQDKAYSALYLDPTEVDGYRRDQSVFGDGINIEDDMAVLAAPVNRQKMPNSSEN